MKDKLLAKVAAFAVVVVLWGTAIFFKSQMSRPVFIVSLIVLLLLSAAVVIWVNMSFFGVSKNDKK
jgi:hypothetical protein